MSKANRINPITSVTIDTRMFKTLKNIKKNSKIHQDESDADDFYCGECAEDDLLCNEKGKVDLRNDTTREV